MAKTLLIIVLLYNFLFFSAPVMGATWVPSRSCGKHSWCAGTGPMASPDDLNGSMDVFIDQSNNWLDTEIINIENKFEVVWGYGLGTELQKNRKSRESLIENQNIQFRDMFVEFLSADSAIDAQRQFGPYARTADLENMVNISSQWQAGEKAKKELVQTHETEFKAFENKWDTVFSASNNLYLKDATKINSEYIFPSSGTFSLDQMKPVQALTELLLNPIPLPQVDIPENTKGYDEAEKKIHAAQGILPERIFFENVVRFSPIIPAGDEITKITHSMGSADKIPEGVKDGKISQVALLTLLSNNKAANPTWYASLVEKNIDGLLRDLIIIKSIKLEEQRQALQITQMTAMLLAQRQANKENQYYIPLLKELHRQTIENKNK